MQQAVIHANHLPYARRLEPRSTNDIDLAVIHCTELPDLPMAREYGERIHHSHSGTGNSGHYYIERSGRIEEWVPLDRIAHHVRGFNSHSIGIELVNSGRFPNWFDSEQQEMTEPYPPRQVQSLIDLLKLLQNRLPGLRWVAGHQSLDTDTVPASNAPHLQVRRKQDPGPLFPWTTVLAEAGLKLLDPGSKST